jgi:hypothetical protein
MLDKFEKEVDPEGKLTIRERAKRAEFALGLLPAAGHEVR